MSGIHDIDENVFGGEGASGEIALIVRIFHSSVVKVMYADGEVVGFVGHVGVSFFDFGSAEVVSIEDASEHGSGHVVGVVEL